MVIATVARIHADIDALKAFKSAVDRFQYEQRQILQTATREIETTRGSLEQKARYWELELHERQRALEECERSAAAAAEHGGGVDCSSLVWAISEAEDKLANVRRWQARVEHMIAAYEGEQHRFRECVEVDVLHARRYLDATIKALAAARATQIE